MLIYKLFRADEWAQFQREGVTNGAPIDLQDGFIHLSTAAQAPETAAKHFSDADDLTLAALDAERLGPELVWEPSRGGALFPHLYRSLTLSEVAWCIPLPLRDGAHRFPEGME